jgi:hypothetical protein
MAVTRARVNCQLHPEIMFFLYALDLEEFIKMK